MTRSRTGQNLDQLVVRSKLSEIAQLPIWIEGLSTRYSIPEDVQFAIGVCLEEVLSNIIRHGYAGADDRSAIVQFTMPRSGHFVFIIDDEAPRFDPLDAPELPALNPGQEMRVGGQGIRFLRHLADAIEYEETPNGNRLRINFSTPTKP